MQDEKFIDRIEFGVYSTEEIKKLSVGKIDSNNLYDPRAGASMDDKEICHSCKQNNKDCPGHFMHIEFNEPILHPLFIKQIIEFLKIFCKSCSKIVFSDDIIKLKTGKLTGFEKFEKLLKDIKDTQICSHCQETQPNIRFKDNNIILLHEQKKNISSVVMDIEDIIKIFENISDENVKMLGFNPKLIHPRNLIMKCFLVIPFVARPSLFADGNLCHDDLTTQILEIVKDNNRIGNEQDLKKKEKFINSLKFHVATFYNNTAGKMKNPSSNLAIKCIKQRLCGKEGLIRQNIMGKRTNFSARTVIGADPYLKMDELAVPIEFTKKLTFPERVLPFNIQHLMNLVNTNQANTVIRGKNILNVKYATMKRGTVLEHNDIIITDPSISIKDFLDSTYPISNLKKVYFGKFYIYTPLLKTEPVLEKTDRLVRNYKEITIKLTEKKHFELKIDDIVERHLKPGDYVLLNRQPTLHKGSMMAFKIVPRPGQTLRLNLMNTRSFNADFDGDEMNIHVPQSYQSVAELKHLYSTTKLLISSQDSKNNVCIIQDVLLGIYLMSKKCVNIPVDKFMQICTQGQTFQKNDFGLWDPHKIKCIEYVYKKFNKNYSAYSTFGLISMIFPNDFYYTNNNKTNPDEPTLKIFKGVFYEGTFDKTVLGQVSNSIIHVMFKEHGEDITVNFINNIHFVVNTWLLEYGFSIGLKDCIITMPSSHNLINDTLTQYYVKAQGIESNTQNVGIREVRITATLSQAKDVGMKIAKDAMDPSNNFLNTVMAGSKGDFFNIAQITGLLGQQNICGQRVKLQLSHKKRTLVHYPLQESISKEKEYESRGFIKSSFINGLNPQEFFFHAMSGRDSICDTAMSTANSGYTQRRIIKIFEDIIIKQDGTVRDTGERIYQSQYNFNGLDPARTIKVNGKQDLCNVSRLINTLNNEHETNEELELESEKEQSKSKPIKEKNKKDKLQTINEETKSKHVIKSKPKTEPKKEKKTTKSKKIESNEINELENALNEMFI